MRVVDADFDHTNADLVHEGAQLHETLSDELRRAVELRHEVEYQRQLLQTKVEELQKSLEYDIEQVRDKQSTSV